ncbi:MAG TPA: thermonuclease family protein [Pseudonocardia sp.]|nr:thermonuclease family protein [Pseudonocardia sp.]
MELRSDIAAAATRMTSGYEVHREIRQLGAYLREGEAVQRLAAGIYGPGAGLLAVTNHRVLLLRDGRSGQASEGFPLERLSAAEWMADGVLGTITVSDSNVTAELRDVPAADGADVVAFIRSITEPRASVPPAQRWPGYGTPTGYASERQGDTGPLDSAATGTATGFTPTATSPALRAVPTQSSAERTGSIGGLTRTTAQHSAVEGSTTGISAVGGSPLGSPTLGSPAVASSGGYPTQVQYPGQPQYPSQGDYPNQGDYPGQPRYAAEYAAAGYPGAEHSSTGYPVQYADQPQYAAPAPAQYAPSADPSAAAAALTRGAVPISVLARTTAIPAQQPAVEPPTANQATVEHAGLEQPHLAEPRVEQPSLGQSPVERSGSIGSPEIMAGEVPVSQLAAEGTASDLLVDGEATVAVPRTSPEQTDQKATAEGSGPTTETESGERPVPINWTAPSESRSRSNRGESSESRTVSNRRPVRLEATNRPPNNAPGGRPGALARSKKWIWLGAGAAGLIGLAALGSAKLIATSGPGGPAGVNPAPVAVDSTVGPSVTITKVIDGDTVEVSGAVNGVVEILGIVAPRVDKEQCGATTSKAYAVKTLNNTTVTLVTDPTQPATDRAGNKLAFLRLPNGADYSVMAVGAGMARYYESPQPVGNAAEIKAAEAQAEKKHTGLWGAPCYGSVTGSGSSTSSSSTGSSSTGSGTSSSHTATNAVKSNSSHTSSESTSGTGNG